MEKIPPPTSHIERVRDSDRDFENRMLIARIGAEERQSGETAQRVAEVDPTKWSEERYRRYSKKIDAIKMQYFGGTIASMGVMAASMPAESPALAYGGLAIGIGTILYTAIARLLADKEHDKERMNQISPDRD